MTLKLASERDLPQIKSYAACSDDALLSDSIINQCLEKHQLFLIDKGKVSVGFIAEQQVLDEAELLQVVIDPAFRNKGLATEALQDWHSHLVEKEVSKVFLEVRESNSAAIRLYEKLGYTTIGERKNYYLIAGVKYNALVMQKVLP